MDNNVERQKIEGDITSLNKGEDSMTQKEYLYKNNQVTIKKNKQEAYINLIPTARYGDFNEEDIIYILNANKVTEGIDKDIIKKIIDEKIYYQDVLVARGSLPVDGEDGYYEFLFNRNVDKKPKILADGSVDYRTLDIIQCVSANDEVVTYHPASVGKNGFDVQGNFLLSKNGREIAPLRGKGFELSEDKKTYRAALDGKIEYMNDRLVISDLFEVKGDVDTSTGDLDFVGDIIINGNIVAGMTVRTQGNITVNGYVESAQIYAGKDVVLKNGMQGGGKGTIEAGGNISGKFFEQVHIKAQGSVRANSILHCNIESKDDVIVSGKLGIIVGGTTSAIKEIRATIIGNESEVKTVINVGITSDLHTKFVRLDEEIKKMVEEINLIDNGINRVSEYIKANPKDNGLVAKRMHLLRAKIEKNTELTHEIAIRDDIIQSLHKSMNAKVVVEKAIYPRTKIIINGSILRLTEEWRNVTLKRKGVEICIFENV